MEEAVGKMIDEDETFGNLRLADGLDKEFADAQKSWVYSVSGAKPEEINEIYLELVKDAAIRRAATPKGLTSVDGSGFADFIDSFMAQTGLNKSSGLGRELDELVTNYRNPASASPNSIARTKINEIFARNKEAMIYLAELSKSTDDAAETIVRRNGLDTYGRGDVARLTNEVEAMFKGGDEAAMMKANV